MKKVKKLFAGKKGKSSDDSDGHFCDESETHMVCRDGKPYCTTKHEKVGSLASTGDSSKRSVSVLEKPAGTDISSRDENICRKEKEMCAAAAVALEHSKVKSGSTGKDRTNERDTDDLAPIHTTNMVLRLRPPGKDAANTAVKSSCSAISRSREDADPCFQDVSSNSEKPVNVVGKVDEHSSNKVSHDETSVILKHGTAVSHVGNDCPSFCDSSEHREGGIDEDMPYDVDKHPCENSMSLSDNNHNKTEKGVSREQNIISSVQNNNEYKMSVDLNKTSCEGGTSVDDAINTKQGNVTSVQQPRILEQNVAEGKTAAAGSSKCSDVSSLSDVTGKLESLSLDSSQSTHDSTCGKVSTSNPVGTACNRSREQVVSHCHPHHQHPVKVFFFVLVDPRLNYNPSVDCVYVRFGSPCSDWKTDIVWMQHCRRTIFMDKKTWLLRGEFMCIKGCTVPYKYVYNGTYEHLLSQQDTTIQNRCLCISRYYDREIWNQFDDVLFILPKKSLKNSIGDLFQTVSRSLGRSSGPLEIAAVTRRLATVTLLTTFANLLEESRIDVPYFLDYIHEIRSCYHNAAIINQHETDWKMLAYPEEILDTFLETYWGKLQELLNSTNKLDEMLPIKKTLTALIVCCIVAKYKIKMELKQYYVLFRSLAITVNDRTEERLPQIVLVTDMIQSDLRSHMTECLRDVICNCISNANISTRDWLFAMPLFHFLEGVSLPYLQQRGWDITLNRYWGVKSLPVEKINRRVCHKDKNLLKDLKQMFPIDHMLSQTYLRIITIAEMEEVINEVDLFHPNDLSAALIVLIQEINLKEVINPITKCILGLQKVYQRLIQKVRDEQKEPRSGILDMVQTAMDFAASLLLSCKKKLLATKIGGTDIIIESYAVFLLTGSLLNEAQQNLEKTGFHKEEHVAKQLEDATKMKQQQEKNIIINLNEWLENAFYFVENFSENKKILQYWTRIFELVPPDVHSEISGKLDFHLKKLSEMTILKQYMNLEQKSVHQIIEGRLDQFALESVEMLCKMNKEKAVLEFHNKQMSPEKCGKMFSKVLESTWPNISHEANTPPSEILKHLLKWRPAVLLLTVTSRNPEICKSLNENGMLCVSVATSCLEHFIKGILDGTIALRDLKIIVEDSNIEIFNNLLAAVDVGDKSTEGSPMSGSEVAAAVKVLLPYRKKELEAYFTQLEYVTEFLSLCTDIEGVDVSQLQQVTLSTHELKLEDVCSPLGLENLVTEKNYSVEVACFGFTLENLDAMRKCVHLKESRIFRKMWKETFLKVIKTDRNKIGKNVTEYVWTDVYSIVLSEWKTFIAALETEDLLLKAVDYLFGNFREELEEELKVLAKYFEKKKQNDLKLNKIKQYFKLQQIVVASHIVNDVKAILKVESKFVALTYVLEFDNSTFKNEKLSSITQEIMKIGKIFESWDPEKQNAVSVLIKCQQLIEWLKETIKGVQEIKTFVDLAAISAGESDIEFDRVTYLYDAVMGYAPFIYDLKPSSCFNDFMKACDHLFKALENDSKLPSKILDTSRYLEWLKSVKEIHGPVETASLMQTEMINKCGMYRVGCIEEKQSSDTILGSVLELSVQQDNCRCEETATECVHGRKYSLDQLEELQSKLMLIAGEAEKGKHEVDKFMELFEGVKHLATAYINLCSAGSVLFLSWRADLYCKEDKKASAVVDFGTDLGILHGKESVLEEVNQLCNFLEKCLQEWKAHISDLRDEFKYLNYYTTEQLVHLSHALAEILSGASGNLSKEILMLLKFVSPQCTIEDVQEFLMAEYKETEEEGLSVATSEEEEIEINSDTTEEKCISQEKEKAICGLKELGVDVEISKSAIAACNSVNVEELWNWCMFNNSNQFEEHHKAASMEMNLEEKGSVTESSISSKELLASLIQFGFEENVSKAAIAACNSQNLDAMNNWCMDNMLNQEKIENYLVQFERINEKHKEYELSYLKEKDYCELPDLCLDESDTRYKNSVLRKVMFTLMKEIKDQSGALVEKLNKVWCQYLLVSKNTLRDYISFQHLGRCLEKLADKSKQNFNRKWCLPLKEGNPNLIICPGGDIFQIVLGLYMEDNEKPLPLLDEVLLCTPETTEEQAELLCRRAFDDKEGKIYCLVNADLLDYNVCTHLEKFLLMSTKREGYRLLIICSAEREEHSYLAAALDTYHIYTPLLPAATQVKSYLKHHLFVDSTIYPESAVQIDYGQCRVRLVASKRAGVGKSLAVKRRFEKLRTQDDSLHTIQLHETHVNVTEVIKFLQENSCCPDEEKPRIYHVDITTAVQYGVESLLFSLSVLNGLLDSAGNLWLCNPRHLYVFEMMDKEIEEINEGTSEKTTKSAVPFHRLLPVIVCQSPQESLAIKQQEIEGFSPEGDTLRLLMDKKKLKSDTYQRPFQYLNKFAKRESLDGFCYASKKSVSQEKCLQVLLSHCCIKDPSWAELQNFSSFLNTQLQDCENSDFCNVQLVGDDLPRFLNFVVGFMIQMSKDFATRSLQDETSDQSAGEVDALTEIHERWRWENKPHPYIFFNRDHHSMSFLGFHVNSLRRLVDQKSQQVIKVSHLERALYRGLLHQGVKFNVIFEDLARTEKIACICKIMGIVPYDPDETYELTLDNVLKMMAIHMKFRCEIPVIIMGETGCGKTRLIRFMCELQRGGLPVKNMLIMKVHGGVTERDIYLKVQEALDTATENKKQGVEETVLFFDEANTTNSIGIIKDIICDGLLRGKHLKRNTGLKCIAACNPYRRHTQTMIRKLESAGLGYHIAAVETVDRLGSIPLRQLVYRVQALPPSLLPLVWDFGCLSNESEVLYIAQIVQRHIKDGKVPQAFGKTLVSVLCASQNFMREQKNECSFVSLRDVERTVEVFLWFCRMQNEIFPRMYKIRAQRQKENSDYKYGDSVNNSDFIRTEKVKKLYKNEKDLEFENLFKDEKEQKGISEDDVPFCEQDLDTEYMFKKRVEEYASGNEEEENTSGNEKEIDVARALMLALGICYHACLENRKGYREEVVKYFQGPYSLPGGAEQFLEEIDLCQDVFLQELRLETNTARNEALKENVFMMVVCVELRIPLFLVGKPGSSKSLAKTVVADAMQGNASYSEFYQNFKQVHMLSFQCSPLATADGILGTFRQCQKFQKNKNLEHFVSVVVLDEVGLAEDSTKMPLKTLHPLLEDGCVGDEDPEPYKKVAFIGISNWALDPAKMNRGILVSRGDPDKRELVKTAQGICSVKASVLSNINYVIPGLAEGYLSVCEKQKKNYFGLRDYYSVVKMIYQFTEEHKVKPKRPFIEHVVRRNFGGLYEDFDPAVEFLKKIPEQRITPADYHPDSSPSGLIQASLKGNGMETRYLLLLTQNNAALNILQQQKLLDMNNTVVIFGSSFSKDQEYTHICRNINRIKVCMETGKTVVLCNLANLYESLYDALNQYYVKYGGNSYVDLGLGSHRVKCRVHPAFKLVVIAEQKEVYEKFPIPLINRLEKHFLAMCTVLLEKQKTVVQKLQKWVQSFTAISVPLHVCEIPTYTEGDVFIGYSVDAIPSVVLQVCHILGKRLEALDDEEYEVRVKREAQLLLLYCATPDAIARLSISQLLEEEKEDIWDTYFFDQSHESLGAYLLSRIDNEESSFLQITTNSRQLSRADLKNLAAVLKCPDDHIKLLSLQQFDTEQMFSKSVSQFFSECQDIVGKILIIQCWYGKLHANHVECARYCVQDQLQQFPGIICNIVFIIQLPRVAGGCFVGFPGGTWHSTHLDDLREETGVQFCRTRSLKGKTLSTLFQENLENKPDKHGDIDTTQLMKSCVQKAASLIVQEDTERSTQRVQILLSLIEDSKLPFDGFPSFLEVMKQCLLQLLQERESRAGSTATDWLCNMAVLGETIKEGSTFSRAVWLKIQNYITPLLAELIAFTDCNNNLDLMTCNTPMWMRALWVQIMGNSAVAEINNFSLLQPHKEGPRIVIPVESNGVSGAFQSRVPFSWVLVFHLDSLLQTALTSKGQSVGNTKNLFRRLVQSSVTGAILATATKDGDKDFVDRYLHDFLKIKYKCKDPRENEAVQHAIRTAARELYSDTVEESEMEPQRLTIPMVHFVYSQIQQRIHCFSLIVQQNEEILARILDAIGKGGSTPSEMILDAMALHAYMKLLEPNFDDLKSEVGQRKWLAKGQQALPIVEQMFSMQKTYGPESMKIVGECRPLWIRIHCFQLFLEHICPPGTDSELQKVTCSQLRILWKGLEDANFKTMKTYKSFVTILTNLNQLASRLHFSGGVHECCICLEAIKEPVALPCKHVTCLKCLQNWFKHSSKKCPKCKQQFKPSFKPKVTTESREAVEKHNAFRSKCNIFFMDVVSRFCFGGDTSPEETIIEDLLKFIIVAEGKNEDKTKSLTPFRECIDPSPVIRSFLLQLLLTCSPNDVQKHMDIFFDSKRTFLTSEEETLEFCLLIISCLEDSYWNQVLHDSEDEMACLASDLLQNCTTGSMAGPLNLKCLQNIASLRFSMSIVAHFLHKICTTGEHDVSRKVYILMERAQQTCTEAHTYMQKNYLHLFLVKQLCQRYGTDYLESLKKRSQYGWVIPSLLKREEEAIPDRFLVHGKNYLEMKESLSKALFKEDLEDLSTFLLKDDITIQKTIYLILSMYHEVTMEYGFRNDERHYTEKGVEALSLYMEKLMADNSLQSFVLSILRNDVGPVIITVNDRGQNCKIGALIIHCVTVLKFIDQKGILGPLISLMFRPQDMQQTLLPTMPEDLLLETMAAVTEGVTWYECKNGHPYMIGECGRPQQAAYCKDCHAPIGGISHRLTQGNRISRRNDSTQKGHVLGPAKQQPKVPVPERNMSPVQVTITKCFLHIAMLYGASLDSQAIANLIQPPISAEAVIQYLKEHLILNIHQLAALLGKNEDDVTTLLHLIIERMLSLPTQAYPANTLGSKDARRQWEKDFNEAYVNPIMQNLIQNLKTVNQMMMKDEHFGRNCLMKILHEVPTGPISLDSPLTLPQMWQYQERISLDNLQHVLEQENAKKECPLLMEFLKEEPNLRALHHLPNVIQLQHLLMQKFHRKIDFQCAQKTTLQEFLNELPEGTTSNTFKELIDSFCDAWNQVRLAVGRQGGPQVPQNLISENITLDSPFAIILPCRQGPGLCSTALVNFLINIHNNFMLKYNRSKKIWSPTVPPESVTANQLIAYKPHDLLMLVTAHCHYTLQVGVVGRGYMLQYDLPSLERHLVDRLVKGRPLIESKIEHFLFRQEGHYAIVFEKLQKKIAQEPLSDDVQHKVRIELQSLTEVCDSLDAISLSLEFLSTSGGDPNRYLKDYMWQVLNLDSKNLLGQKAQQHCQLKHVVSLWHLLALTRSQRMKMNKQNPFDTVPECYCEAVNSECMEAVKKSLHHLKVEVLLQHLHEFIIHILTKPPTEEDSGKDSWKLGEVLYVYLEGKDIKIPELITHFPKKVLVKHAVKLWEILVPYSQYSTVHSV